MLPSKAVSGASRLGAALPTYPLQIHWCPQNAKVVAPIVWRNVPLKDWGDIEWYFGGEISDLGLLVADDCHVA